MTRSEAEALLNEYMKEADEIHAGAINYALISIDMADNYQEVIAGAENEKMCDGSCNSCWFNQPEKGCITKCKIKRFISQEGEFAMGEMQMKIGGSERE